MLWILFLISGSVTYIVVSALWRAIQSDFTCVDSFIVGALIPVPYSWAIGVNIPITRAESTRISVGMTILLASYPNFWVAYTISTYIPIWSTYIPIRSYIYIYTISTYTISPLNPHISPYDPHIFPLDHIYTTSTYTISPLNPHISPYDPHIFPLDHIYIHYIHIYYIPIRSTYHLHMISPDLPHGEDSQLERAFRWTSRYLRTTEPQRLEESPSEAFRKRHGRRMAISGT